MNPRHDHSLVPFGLYQGTPWEEAPESWLYFIARRGNFLGKLCRKEIRRRCGLNGTRTPIWTDEISTEEPTSTSETEV